MRNNKTTWQEEYYLYLKLCTWDLCVHKASQQILKKNCIQVLFRERVNNLQKREESEDDIYIQRRCCLRSGHPVSAVLGMTEDVKRTRIHFTDTLDPNNIVHRRNGRDRRKKSSRRKERALQQAARHPGQTALCPIVQLLLHTRICKSASPPDSLRTRRLDIEGWGHQSGPAIVLHVQRTEGQERGTECWSRVLKLLLYCILCCHYCCVLVFLFSLAS